MVGFSESNLDFYLVKVWLFADIVLVGEGYSDYISIDNVHGATATGVFVDQSISFGNESIENQASEMMDDAEIKGFFTLAAFTFTIQTLPNFVAPKSNHLDFGDVYLSQKRQMSFTLTNHSKGDCMRFEFPSEHPHLTFSPSVGHLRSNCAKDIVVTFKSASPVEIKMEEVLCSLKKIKLFPEDSMDQVLSSSYECFSLPG